MPKRILLLTFYYPPDLSAGSFRAHALLQALCANRLGGVHVDVLTTQPNRYWELASNTEPIEHGVGVRVRRLRLPVHRGGLKGQAISFLAFSYQVTRHLHSGQYDVVIATSSRLMTASLGAWIAYRQRARLYLDIRDIFVENLGELFPAPAAKPLKMIFGVVERLAIWRADKVNLVSPGFLAYFQPRYPDNKYTFHPNGVDEEFADFPVGCTSEASLSQPLQILYAGNIGDGQGLHFIVPQLARRLGRRVHFRIVGSGGRLQVLRKAISAESLKNVELVEPVPRAQLLSFYLQADVLFVHLNDFKAFRRVLPSKLFEYAATGKPIWAGVAGYAAEFIKSEISNTAVFAPCDADAAVIALDRLSLQSHARSDFVERFSRSRIMKAMADDVLKLVEDRP